MAQQDITGLLTGIFTGDPVAQQQQLLSQQAVAQNPNLLASTQTQIGRAPAQLSRMRQNVGGMFGQDLRSSGQKVQEQLKGLDVTKPEGQQQAVSLISQIDLLEHWPYKHSLTKETKQSYKPLLNLVCKKTG